MDNLPSFVKDHIEYLERLDLDKRSLEEIKNDVTGQNQSKVPYFEMSQFMRFSWDGVISPSMKSGWLERTIKPKLDLEDFHQGVLEFYDQSDLDGTLKSLKNLYDKGIDEDDLFRVIRESQKSVLGSLFMTIDGTTDGCAGSFFETKIEDNEIVPKRNFYGMEDFFLDYDPIKLKNKIPD